MYFMEYALKNKDNDFLKDKIQKEIFLNHISENEVFSGYFNPIHEAIWIIAKDHFTKQKSE